VQLATIGLDGRPAVRTVVFRGFLGEGGDLVFTTDARSTKRAEIERAPDAALCWYFAETREQFRLSGVVRLVDASTADAQLQDARCGAWRSLSDESRTGFTWPAPGEPRDRGTAFPTTPPARDAPLDSFALLIVSVREIDHLELDGDPQRRWKYAVGEDGRWSCSEVNP
jgi:PPOX class probable FMN-dependent enzyme